MTTRCKQTGDTRIKRRFLLIPKCIKSELRWLELAEWEEEYSYNWASGGEWIETRWIHKG